ncbi:MAG: phosphohistidine phosphatase SixA [Polyangia bacterium]
MKELYLIRHARAVDHAANDWERALQPEGRKEARTVGAALLAQHVGFDCMAVSPLVRAVETATLVAVETGYEGGLFIDAALTPDGSTNQLIALCGRLVGDRVALVGHEPSMGQLLSDLVGRPGMSLVKAGVVKLLVDDAPQLGKATLVWTMSPRHLTPTPAQ